MASSLFQRRLSHLLGLQGYEACERLLTGLRGDELRAPGVLAWLPPGDSSRRLARSGGAAPRPPVPDMARRPRLCRLSGLLTARWNADADVWLCFAALLGAWSCPGWNGRRVCAFSSCAVCLSGRPSWALSPVSLCEPGQADAVSTAGEEAALPGVTCTSPAGHLAQNHLQSSHSGLMSASSRGLGRNRRAASSRVTLKSLAGWSVFQLHRVSRLLPSFTSHVHFCYSFMC